MNTRSITLQTFSKSSGAPNTSELGANRLSAFGDSRKTALSPSGMESNCDGRASIDAKTSELVKHFEEACAGLLAEVDDYRQSLQLEFSALLARTISDCAPHISYASTIDALSDLVSATSRMDSRERIEIRARNNLIMQLGSLIEKSENASRFTLVADDSMENGSLRANWTGGGVTHDPALVIRSVIELLEKNTATQLNDGAQ